MVGQHLIIAGLGEIAWQRKQIEASAKLSGCASGAEKEIGLQAYNWRADYQRLITAARERLTDPAYAAAWAEGEKLSANEAFKLSSL